MAGEGPAKGGSMQYFILGLFVIALALLVMNVRIVPQAQAWVIEHFGVYHKTWTAGIHMKWPYIDRIARQISLKEQVADFAPQPVITKDNVTMQIDSVVYFRVFDPKLFTYGVERPITAIENLCATTLRNIVGGMELDSTLTSRDVINGQITHILDEATDKWGIKINRVEVKNIMPPREIQDSMEKQMKAERDKRQAILLAEGEKQAAITRAEGEKESAILRADAAREKAIREAAGQAEAILTVQRAQAEAIRLMNEARPTDKVLALRSLEALAQVADGRATKLIIPSDVQNLSGLIPTMRALAEEQKAESAEA